VTEGIFAVLYVSIMGLTRCYKTTVFYISYSMALKTSVNLGHADQSWVGSGWVHIFQSCVTLGWVGSLIWLVGLDWVQQI